MDGRLQSHQVSQRLPAIYRNDLIECPGACLIVVAQGRALIGEGALIREEVLISFSFSEQ